MVISERRLHSDCAGKALSGWAPPLSTDWTWLARFREEQKHYGDGS